MEFDLNASQILEILEFYTKGRIQDPNSANPLEFVSGEVDGNPIANPATLKLRMKVPDLWVQ